MPKEILDRIKRNVAGAEHVKQYCSEESLLNLSSWATLISRLQLQYRKIFNNNKQIVSTCQNCSMCCQSHLGTGGIIEVSDAFYYSMMDIDFDRIKQQAEQEKLVWQQETKKTLPPMCLFWSPNGGCKLPDNARPRACVQYVCSINLALSQQESLRIINTQLNQLYSEVPVSPNTVKLKQKQYE